MYSSLLPIQVFGEGGMRLELLHRVVITPQFFFVWNQVMNGVVARLAHENRLLHLLCCEGALPPILSMAMSGYQMMFAVNFVDPTELAQHENLFRSGLRPRRSATKPTFFGRM